MFCSDCGKQLPENSTSCTGCGKPIAKMGSGTDPGQRTNFGSMVGEEVKARTHDAWRGIKLFARSPVGGLQESFELYDTTKAVSVAIVFAIFNELLFFIALFLSSKKINSYIPFNTGDFTINQFLKIIIIGIIPVSSLTMSATIARLIFRGKGTFVGDLYFSSAALLPFGVLILFSSILGPANIEIIAVLMIFSLTYLVLMLYAGCSRIAGIPEIGAAPAVPIMLILTAWITKIVMSSIFS